MYELVSGSARKGCLKPQDVAKHTLQAFLIPGEISFSALADTLTELGKPVSRKDLEGQSTAQIINFLVSVSFCSLQMQDSPNFRSALPVASITDRQAC